MVPFLWFLIGVFVGYARASGDDRYYAGAVVVLAADVVVWFDARYRDSVRPV
jgi:hypothetical protein